MLYKEFSISEQEVYDEAYADAFEVVDGYSGGQETTQFFRRVLEPVVGRHPDSARLLDVGCGVGALLETARDMRFDVSGVEISPVLAGRARERGFSVHVGDVAELSIAETYDVIVMLDIIEHLHNPGEVLTGLRRLLRPGGELVVYTPNHGSPVVRVSEWLYRLGVRSPAENIFASTHTCFFATESLRRLIQNHGFRINVEEHFAYDTARPGQRVSWLEKAAIRAIEKSGELLGARGFRMVFYTTPES